MSFYTGDFTDEPPEQNRTIPSRAAPACSCPSQGPMAVGVRGTGLVPSHPHLPERPPRPPGLWRQLQPLPGQASVNPELGRRKSFEPHA